MKLIIAGSRDFADYRLAKMNLDYFLEKTYEDIEIVSGACHVGVHTFTRDDETKIYGADGLGERYAKEYDYPVKPFPADWDKFGNSAGAIRNKEMAAYATHCICFWDGVSRGTKDMIKQAKAKGLPLRIIQYSEK